MGSALLIATIGLTLPHPPPTTAVFGRRAALVTPLALAAFSLSPRPAEAAVPACPKGSNNCLSTAGPTSVGKLTPWKFPAGMSKPAAVASLRSVLQAYPQEGQAGVDLGGWSFADDQASRLPARSTRPVPEPLTPRFPPPRSSQLASSGYARLEFKSGIGNFARFFNGGKPFIDDFEVSVGDGAVDVRSSSRIGDSDLGVNTKRVNYIAAALRAKGWDAPGVA